MIFIPACGLVAASFLDGGLLLLDAASGDIRLRAKMLLDGLPALVHAMDAQGDKLAMGTADGRIAVNAVGELLARDTTTGWVEIG